MIKAKQNPDGTITYSFETEPDLRMWFRVTTGDSRKYYQEPYKPDLNQTSNQEQTHKQNNPSTLVLNPTTGKPEQKAAEQPKTDYTTPSPVVMGIPTMFERLPTTPTPPRKTWWRNNPRAEIMKQETLEYFKSRPELLVEGNNYQRNDAINRLSDKFNINYRYVKDWLIDAGLLRAYAPLSAGSGKQYHFIYEHLDELIAKYKSLTCPEWQKPKPLGLTRYSMDIMLYLAGMHEKITPKDLFSIKRMATQLGIPVRSPS